MSCKIDSRAAIALGAQLGENVEVGPFAVIDADVIIGDNCKIAPHAHITGHTTIGSGTVVHTGAVLGGAPQDVHYNDEVSYVVIGNNCIIREYVTVHRGTEAESYTRIGNNVMLMALSHIGHNCQIGNGVIVANTSLLAGRVEVSDNAFVSGGCQVHQYVRIGRMAMVGGGNAVGQDVPPFCLLQSGCVYGPNVVGLRRAGFSEQVRDDIREAIKLYFFGGMTNQNAIAAIREKVPSHPEIEEFVTFLEGTKRGIVSGFNKNKHR